MKSNFKRLKRASSAVIAVVTILAATNSGAQAGSQTVSRSASSSVKKKLVVNGGTPSPEPALLSIQLLQEIFQRIHDYGALALQNMHKARENMIKQEGAPSPAHGPTNIFLAIKPPVTVINSQSFNSQSFANQQTRNHQIAMAPGRAALFIDQRQATTGNFHSAAEKKSPIAAAPAPSATAPAAPPQEPVVDATPVSGGYIPSAASAQFPREASPSLADLPRAGDNATAGTGRRFGVAEYGNTGAANTVRSDARVSQTQTKSNMPATKTDSLVAAAPAAQPAGPVINPAHRESYKSGLREYAPTEKSEARPVKTAMKSSLAVTAKDKHQEIAFLPPNVVTGVHLIHLGYSAAQANQLLTSRGKLTKLMVKDGKGRANKNGWSVWILNKRGSNDPAMYIYIRHGIVEALRVFDPYYIRPEFGVRLGAGLSEVKRKFGEPAFMLEEPGAVGAGQNYVYPISQVCFQVARKQPNDEPQLVSILIFTVKGV